MTTSISKLDLGIGLVLAAFGAFLVSGRVHDNTDHAGIAAMVMVLFMTLPVVWRRPAPVVVAAVLAAGAVANPLIIGRMIRCGPALPALLFCAFAIGRKSEHLNRAVIGVGLALLVTSACVQSFTDPQLDGGVIVAMAPMIVGFYLVGRVIESRSRLVAQLEAQNEELRRQRRRRADLAVEADRARIAAGLEGSLNAEIADMRDTALLGQQALTDDRSQSTREAFESIQQRGRQTLAHMRRVVGTLREPDEEPTAPQPSLSQLDRLVDRAHQAEVHLHVTGSPKVLPPGVEVSSYRALENLLDAFGDAPGQRIDISVDFAAEALTLSVRGPVPPSLAMQEALAAARARVDLYHGLLSSTHGGEHWETSLRLPLSSAGLGTPSATPAVSKGGA